MIEDRDDIPEEAPASHKEESLIAAQVLEKTGDVSLAEAMLDPNNAKYQPQSDRNKSLVKKIGALCVWIITVTLASLSSLPKDVVGTQSATSELIGVSTLGLLIVLFANESIGAATGMYWTYSWIYINKPSPASALRLLGWLMLIFVLGFVLIFLIQNR